MYDNDYAMFSDDGNMAVQSMMTTLFYGILNGKLLVRHKDLVTYIGTAMEEIAQTHSEVHDTAVRECIIGSLHSFLKRNGFGESSTWPGIYDI